MNVPLLRPGRSLREEIGFDWVCIGFVLSEPENAVFFIIPFGKEVCIGFFSFEVWLCFFGARTGDLFSYPSVM